MNASVFKEFSNVETVRTAEAGKTLAENFPDIDFENAVALVNGKEAASGQIVNEGDVILIRVLPGVATTLAVAAIVLAVGGGIACGVLLYKQKKALDKANEELEKMKKAGASDSLDNRPFLRGANNAEATGKSLAYICGRHFFTPYLLAPTYYRLSGTDGADQYAYITLAAGFGPLVFDQISVDDIKIKDFHSPLVPQEGSFALDQGTVFFEDGLLEIAQDGAPLSAIPELNYRHASTSSNQKIPTRGEISDGTAEELLFTLDSRAKDVDVAISFPYGLYEFNDDYEKRETSITILPQYSLDGGRSWTSFTFNQNGTLSNTFRRNESKKELRFVAHKDFTWADAQALKMNGQSAIQLRLYNEGTADAQKYKNDCYCLFYQSTCYDPSVSSGTAGLVSCKTVEDRERAFVSIIALKIKATPSNEDKLSRINLIAEGMARTWNGVAWSAEKNRTRNPAAIALEILTSACHGASRFDDAEIDLESFGAWYEYCEQEGFRFDSALTQGAKKSATLQNLADVCGAMIYRDMFGRIAAAIDCPKENAVAVYNAQNVKSVENKKTFDRKRDGVRIKYTTSEGDLFAEETYIVMREENGAPLPLTGESILEDITVSGVTTYEHIVKYARRMMAKEILRPKTTTIRVGNEGVYLAPFCKILLQDDSLKIGLDSGVIREVVAAGTEIVGFELDHPVRFEEGKNYGLVINCFGVEGARTVPCKILGEGETASVRLSVTLSAEGDVVPEAGNVWSFGELDGDSFSRVTTEYLIAGIQSSQDGYSLELVNYHEAVYESGSIPPYTSNLTQRPPESAAEIPDDFVTSGDLNDALGQLQNGNGPVQAIPDAPDALSAAAEKDRISLRCAAGGTGLKNTIQSIVFRIVKADGTESVVESAGFEASYVFDRDVDGYPEADALSAWRVFAKAVNIYGIESAEAGGLDGEALDLSEYKTWLAPVCAVEGCVAKQDGIYSEWEADETLTFGDLRFSFALFYNRAEQPDPVAQKTGMLALRYDYLFNRNADADGYPEKADVIAQLEEAGLPVRGRNLSLYEIEITAYTLQRPDAPSIARSEILADYYGTWMPADIRSLSAAAARDAVEIEITPELDTKHYGTPYSFIVEILKGEGAQWTRVESASSLLSIPFDRDVDGYPEADALSAWRVRVKAVSQAGNESPYWGGTEAGATVSTDAYGTWIVSEPEISVTVSGRSVTLAMQQPPLAQARERYGSVRHRLQIQKPEESEAWKKPAQNLNPYEDEANWQAGEGEITVGDVYTQTMPLSGQTLRDVEVEGETVRQSAPVSTLYRFRVTAFSEANEAQSVEVNATALATGIQDIVQGSVTHDKISTPSLAAISANMGVISSGGFAGNAYNYWYLSTIMGQIGVEDRYEGSMRVGGADEYLIVEPIVESGVVRKYKITFKVGNFEVSSEASRVNGELVIMQAADALDRTRITPFGTYYEHRETSASENWTAISQMRTDGIRAASLYSEQTLVVTNSTLQERRKRGIDVGRPFLSDAARVWHFDTDLLDQKQNEGLAIESVGDVFLADQYNSSGGDIDFTPAILAVAPYSEIGRSAYGQFRAEITLEASNTLTIDFWIQYIWNENQILFDIGNAVDRIRLEIANDEAYFNDFQEERDAAPLNEEIRMSGDVVVLNEPEPASSTIQHYGNTVPVPLPDHVRSFDQLGIEFERNQWLHVGIVLSESEIACYLNKTPVSFARYATAADGISVRLNDLMTTLILDELYIDARAAESFEDFAANTDARIPWGALDRAGKYFILDAENLITNIFDTDAFKEKVKAIIKEGTT